jgi:hypothetical protein
MTSQVDEDMQPVRNLWAAVVERAILDYRHAVMNGDEIGSNRIAYELEVMGYGQYVAQLRRNALAFAEYVDREAKKMPPDRKVRSFECPGCKSARAVLYRGKRNIIGICFSCGLRHLYPLSLEPIKRRKEEDG